MPDPEKETEQFERCQVYADANVPSWLRFKRDIGGLTVRCCMLSAAMDFADFSHFEYAAETGIGKSLMVRWIQADVTLYPQFVVFRKKP